MDFVILILGFLLLVKGADFFVDGASSIAKIFKVSPMLIGLTIVAFGTSAPEMAVSVSAAIKGSNEIALGNVIGSNLFNLLCVVGLSAFLNPFKIKDNTIKKEFPLMIFGNVVLLFIAFDKAFFKKDANILSRFDGLILLALFVVFLVYLISMGKNNKDLDEDVMPSMSISKSIILGIIGLGGIIWGGDLVVNSATSIATKFGMSEKLVGLTIVALGTSLPELVTSIVAATKGESEIALGNVIGSNLFNMFLILGTSSFIHPINVSTALFFDIAYLLIFTIITYIFAITRRTVLKGEGIFMLTGYVAYMAYIIARN